MPKPTEPYDRALASLRAFAELIGARPSAIAVDNIREPSLPDWDLERRCRDLQTGATPPRPPRWP